MKYVITVQYMSHLRVIKIASNLSCMNYDNLIEES